MSMKILMLAAAMFVVQQMDAATIYVSLGGSFCTTGEGVAGLCSSRANSTTVSFDSLAGTAASPYSDGIATYSWSGALSPFVTGSVSGAYAAPGATRGGNWTDTTTYLTTGSSGGRPSTVTIDFKVPINYFGLYVGSPDSYNHMQFEFFGSGTSETLDGYQILNPADGSWASSGYVNFDISGGSIDRIVLTSDTPAFETDNHAYAAATPEPLSMLLLGSGLVGIGIWGRRRKRA